MTLTLEERVTRLEQRGDQLDRLETRLERIDTRLGHVEESMVGLRTDFNTYRSEHGAILERILATLDSHDRTLREILVTLPRLGFRWPWEARP